MSIYIHPYIYLYLPISTYIYLYLPMSTYMYLYVPISTCIREVRTYPKAMPGARLRVGVLGRMERWEPQVGKRGQRVDTDIWAVQVYSLIIGLGKGCSLWWLHPPF